MLVLKCFILFVMNIFIEMSQLIVMDRLGLL